MTTQVEVQVLNKKIDLVVLVAGDEMLYNPYGIIAVNPHKYPQVKYAQAREFIAFLTFLAIVIIYQSYRSVIGYR